ncbi:hypothetical protein OC861_003565 [Tilletia horrida]|nr:hypothetical protein OC861_003565 [Tilletia horrida]
MQRSVFASAALAASAFLIGANALPATSSASATVSCSSTPLWSNHGLNITELLGHSKPGVIATGTNHNSHDRLLAYRNATEYTSQWAFHVCQFDGVPKTKSSDDVVYGRLKIYDEGCAVVDAYPKLDSGVGEIVWVEACAGKKETAKATRQLFSYSKSSKEIQFIGDSASKKSTGVYVFAIHEDDYLPKFPLKEVAIRKADTFSSKHYKITRA